MTHILCIPFTTETIMASYDQLVTKIKGLKVEGVQDQYFQESNLLHVTLCSLDFNGKEAQL